MAHAILSASGSHRWLECTPSAQLERTFPDEKSVFAAEGTLGHELGEVRLRHYLGEIDDAEQRLAQLREHELYSAELEEAVDVYVEHAVAEIENARTEGHTFAWVEQRLDFSDWVPEGFGTGDLVVINGRTARVVDAKFGRGKHVRAQNNTQLSLYGLGLVAGYGMLHDFDTVRLVISQPRVSREPLSWEITREELVQWGQAIRPRAELAWAGEGDFVPGDHCGFCRARHQCSARAQHHLQMAKLDFRSPALLSHDELAHVLSQAKALADWAGDVESWALDQAVNHGRQIPGWKLVEGKSNRVITNVDEVARALSAAGVSDIYEPPALKTLTRLEKLVGTKRFGELAGHLVHKPAGKPVLVPATDPRTELSSAASAVADFSRSSV